NLWNFPTGICVETHNDTFSPSTTPCDDKSLDATPQRDVILQLLNSAAETELAAVKLLRGRKSVNIVEYRTRNGPLENLESVTNVPLLKHKSAVIVFNSILNPPEKEKSKDPASQVHQTRGGKDLARANSIVSIVCGVNKIAWVHVDHGMNVLEWKHEDCHNFLKGTYMASLIIQLQFPPGTETG
uniref:Transcription elongation factor, mitochondrial n=1 Tax=Oncorhynchus kisutch TaxID=8019 RepID=A0A8C7HMI0_ONCKI